MIGAGTILNPILKIVTTVAILAAVYFFIVRPVLDTTESAIDQGARISQEAQADARERTQQIAVDTAKSRLDSSILSLQTSDWPEAVKAVRTCKQDAGNDANALEKCIKFAQKISTALRSNRTFALSYANSLSTQGRNAEAGQVRDCVDNAEFKVGAMQRCRNLADKLLFNR